MNSSSGNRIRRLEERAAWNAAVRLAALTEEELDARIAAAEERLAELEPLVARAFRSGYVDNEVLTFEDFQADLRVFRAAPDRRALLEERGLKPIDDALDALAVFEEEEEEEPVKPAENPNRSIGRNDPCPCGSGKKYKKCCLGAEQG